MRCTLPARALVCFLGFSIATPMLASADDENSQPLRIASFNVRDLRARDVDSDQPYRAEDLAKAIRSFEPHAVLLNEVAYEPDKPADANLAHRFVEKYLSGDSGFEFEVFVAPVNTGIHSGYDLDNSGGMKAEPGGRDYANDCLGYGNFEGQFAMALLVRAPLTIDLENVRTFQNFLWAEMPDAALPPGSSGDGAWFDDEELEVVRLSSKSHWDVPVKLPDGRVIHLLCSHPTPPVFDGPEDRNGRRNHDEIRFWRDYISGESYMTDDQGKAGGLHAEAPFVILGDLNADPDEGDSRGTPIADLVASQRVADIPAPRSLIKLPGLDPDDTAHFKLRADYVLPSSDLEVAGSGVWRGPEDSQAIGIETDDMTPDGRDKDFFPSDHYPVWVDVIVPAAT